MKLLLSFNPNKSVREQFILVETVKDATHEVEVPNLLIPLSELETSVQIDKVRRKLHVKKRGELRRRMYEYGFMQTVKA